MKSPSPFQALIMVLATYRLARLIVQDTLFGHWPKGVDEGDGLRRLVDRFAFDEAGDNRSFLRGKVGDLLQCIFCTGFWCAVGTYFATMYGPDWLHVAVLIFAVAGGAGFIGSRMNA